MSAELRALPAAADTAPRSVYLDAYLAPFRPFLARESVTEILVNRPGELWIEEAGTPAMQRVARPGEAHRRSADHQPAGVGRQHSRQDAPQRG